MLSQNAKDLIILSAQGYQKTVMFQDNARATLKIMRDEEEEDDIDTTLNIIAKTIKDEVVVLGCEKGCYHRRISKSAAADSVSNTLQLLLQKLSPLLNAATTSEVVSSP